MRGLCGWSTTRRAEDGQRALASMLAASGHDLQAANVGSAAGGCMAAFGASARPRIVVLPDIVLAVAGHPRLRGGHRDAAAALAAVLQDRWAGALADIGGDFAIAAWSPGRRRGLLAIDRMGAHQLVYTSSAEGVAFGSTLDMIAAAPGVRRRLSEQALYDYLYFHVSPGPTTAYQGMLRVPAGEYVEFDEHTPSAPVAYWRMQFRDARDTTPVDLAALKDEFKALLEQAVRDAAQEVPVGSFLSGGTDSSTVSGMLGRAGNGPARTFSIGFDQPGYDETAYARIAAQHFGLEHHEYYVTPSDVVDAVPKIAAAYDQPFGNASAVPTYFCAKFAREHGVQRLLAGDGGDELFGGNERYARQYLLSLYERVPDLLKSGLIEPLLLSAPLIGTIFPFRKLRSYVLQARPPMPLRYESYNLLQHLGAQNMLCPDFLASIDVEHPRRLLGQAHAPFAAEQLVDQMLGIDFRFTLNDGDLPKVGNMCNLAGIDVAYPLLDDRLIEFSGRLPAHMKLRGTHLRWFFKEALRDFLPNEIITKKKHGFGLPVGQWLMSHKPLFDLARDGMGVLTRRRIVREDFVAELVGPRMQEDAGYFGNMIWVLMMLGLWLESRHL